MKPVIVSESNVVFILLTFALLSKTSCQTMDSFFRLETIFKSLPLGGKKVISDHKFNNMFKACIFSTKDCNVERYLSI